MKYKRGPQTENNYNTYKHKRTVLINEVINYKINYRLLKKPNTSIKNKNSNYKTAIKLNQKINVIYKLINICTVDY